MKKLLSLLILMLALGLSAAAQDKCERFTDEWFGISFCIPAGGWEIREVKGAGSVIFGERVGNFLPNINVRSVNMPGTVSRAADIGIAYILKTKPGGTSEIELVSKRPFTAGRASGYKIVFKAQTKDFTAKSIQYYFSGKRDAKVVVTATLPWSGAAELEEATDAALKTYELLKKEK